MLTRPKSFLIGGKNVLKTQPDFQFFNYVTGVNLKSNDKDVLKLVIPENDYNCSQNSLKISGHRKSNGPVFNNEKQMR